MVWYFHGRIYGHAWDHDIWYEKLNLTLSMNIHHQFWIWSYIFLTVSLLLFQQSNSSSQSTVSLFTLRYSASTKRISHKTSIPLTVFVGFLTSQSRLFAEAQRKGERHFLDVWPGMIVSSLFKNDLSGLWYILVLSLPLSYTSNDVIFTVLVMQVFKQSLWFYKVGEIIFKDI